MWIRSTRCVTARSSLLKPRFIDSTKAYPDINSHNATFITALGDVCSAIEQLPTSAVLTTGLEKFDDIAIESGGMGDVWRGRDRGEMVAIKAFRIHLAPDLKTAKQVRISSTAEVCFRTKFTDSVETSASVEKAIP